MKRSVVRHTRLCAKFPVIPTRERSEAGGICCPSHKHEPHPHPVPPRRLGRPTSSHRRPSDHPTSCHSDASEAPLLVIPTRERSEAGGICCPSLRQRPHPHSVRPRRLSAPHVLSFRRLSEAKQEESAVPAHRQRPHPHSVPPRHHESALHLLPHKSKKEPDCEGAMFDTTPDDSAQSPTPRINQGALGATLFRSALRRLHAQNAADRTIPAIMSMIQPTRFIL